MSALISISDLKQKLGRLQFRTNLIQGFSQILKKP